MTLKILVPMVLLVQIVLLVSQIATGAAAGFLALHVAIVVLYIVWTGHLWLRERKDSNDIQ